MPHPATLIDLLNQPGPHTDAAIARVLDVSAAQVKAEMQQLQSQGLPVDSLRNCTYSLPDGVRMLDAERIADYLEPSIPLDSFEVFASLASTNSHLLEQTTAPGRVRICLTESQTSGRGRRGNEWLSAPYRNVMLSMSWSFVDWPKTLTGLGLAAALSVAEELNREYATAVTIKWPNDLLVGDDKLAGILIDVSGEPGGACTVVMGLGLNVDQPDWSEPATAAYRWQDLKSLGVSTDRNQLVAQIINAWLRMLQNFTVDGFSTLVPRWNQLSSYSERKVRVGEQGSNVGVTGDMLGVDECGALIVVDDQGVKHSFTDSLVSVRLV